MSPRPLGNESNGLLSAVASLPESNKLLEELKIIYQKTRASTKVLEELEEIRREISDQVAKKSDPVTCQDWKQIYDKLVSCKLKLKGKPEVNLVPSIMVQWRSVALRLLSEHVQAELVPYLKLLISDLVNLVDLHSIPQAFWTAPLLRDAVKTAVASGSGALARMLLDGELFFDG